MKVRGMELSGIKRVVFKVSDDFATIWDRSQHKPSWFKEGTGAERKDSEMMRGIRHFDFHGAHMWSHGETLNIKVV